MTLAIAFLGGVASCLSPCVLPVIPVFLAQLRGPVASWPGAPGGTDPGASRARASGFLLGFAGVFVALWVSLGLGGAVLIQAVPSLRPLAGGAIALFGVTTVLGWAPRIPGADWRGARPFGGSFLLGAGIAVGWTPCIGPTLGAILSLVAASGSVWSGTALLLAYALGMALPLALIGLGLQRFRPLAGLVARRHGAIRVTSGAVMIIVGYLVATNEFARLAGLVSWTV